MHSVKFGVAMAMASLAVMETVAAETTIGIGAEYTTGKYGGTADTETVFIPINLKHETGRWALKATVPYIRITGPANIIGAGAERITLPGASAESRTESGLGDIVTSAFYTVLNERESGLGLDLGVKVKLPTADEERALGTGELDYALQADVFKPLGDVTLFGSLGYRYYGDPPGLDLRNVPYYAIGFTYRTAPGSTIGVAYDHRPRVVDGGAKISEATLFWSRRLSREWRLQVYGVAGFSDASPDAGVGAGIDYRF